MLPSKVSVCIYSTVTKSQEDSEIHIESFSNNDSVGYKLVEVVWYRKNQVVEMIMMISRSCH